MNELWKIKLGEDQDLYKRCSMILVSASFIRNWVQPPQTIHTERLIHSFLCAIVMSMSSKELLSIYSLSGKETSIYPSTWTKEKAEQTENFCGISLHCSQLKGQTPCWKTSAAKNNITDTTQSEFSLGMPWFSTRKMASVKPLYITNINARKLNVHCIETQNCMNNNTHWGHYIVQSLHTYKSRKLFL